MKQSLFDELGQLSQWAMDHPIEGSLAFCALYLVGVPLTIPPMIILLFGSFAYTHMFGLKGNNVRVRP